MSREKINKVLNALDGAEVGARLRREREKRGLILEDIAKALGVGSAQAVSNYEKGQIPNARLLAKYATLLETSVDWLLTGKRSGNINFKIGEVPLAWGKELDRADRTIIDELVEFLGEASQGNKNHLRNQIQQLLFADRYKKLKKG